MPLFSNMPSFQQLADEAKENLDSDAALQLARRAPDKGFLSWLARWVKPGEMTAEIFDVFADSYRRMELEKLDAQCRDIDEKVQKEAA